MGERTESAISVLNGVCRFCGSLEQVIAMSQEEADAMVTDKCTCWMSRRQSEYDRMITGINVIANRSGDNQRFEPLDINKYNILITLGEMIFRREMSKVVIDLPDSRVVIAGKKDSVAASRIKQDRLEMED